MLQKLRDNNKQLLESLFKSHNIIEDPISAARRIERSIYNATYDEASENYIKLITINEKFIELYSNRMYKVYCNLDSNMFGNNYLQNKVSEFMTNGSGIDPNKVGYLTSEEIFPGRNDKIKEELKLRMAQKIKTKTSNMFRCPNCKERKTTYYEKQMRSFDEPATVFITCTPCGYQWRKG